MNLQNLKIKASTLCAGGTLLVFGGFLTVNLAGCGGGGGGLTTIPTPSPVGATFFLVQQDSSPSNGGTLTLTGNGQTFNGTADSSGKVVLSGVTPGTYTATFIANSSAGALPSTSRTIVVTKSGAQNFVLVQGDTGNGAFTLSGTVFQNSNNGDFTNCTSNSAPITADLLISVRDLNDTTGAPIIAQIVRPVQDANASLALRGRYTISLPTNPRSFRVEVGPATNNGVIYAGISATTTFTQGVTSLTNVNVCANTNGKNSRAVQPDSHADAQRWQSVARCDSHAGAHGNDRSQCNADGCGRDRHATAKSDGNGCGSDAFVYPGANGRNWRQHRNRNNGAPARQRRRPSCKRPRRLFRPRRVAKRNGRCSQRP